MKLYTLLRLIESPFIDTQIDPASLRPKNYNIIDTTQLLTISDNIGIDSPNRNSTSTTIYDLKTKKAIGSVSFFRNHASSKVLTIKNIFVEPQYRGQNISLSLYLYLISSGFTLRTDDIQLGGGKAIWEQLLKRPDITLTLYDKTTRTRSNITSQQEFNKAYDTPNNTDTDNITNFIIFAQKK